MFLVLASHNSLIYIHYWQVQLYKKVQLKITGTKSYKLCPGGVLPYMGYIGMCGPKGYGFSARLVINRVSILAILPPFWS